MPGDRLAIMARTTYEWTLLDFAAWAAGLVTVPVYPTSSAFQARWILQDSGAVAPASWRPRAGRGPRPRARPRCPTCEHLWSHREGARGPADRGGRADVPDAEVEIRRGMLGPDTLATLIYTSGTTGRPKGCVAHPRQLLRRGRQRHRTALPGLPGRQNDDEPPSCSSCRCRTSSAGWSPSPACARGSAWATRPSIADGGPAGRPRRPSGRPSCWPSRTCWRRSSTPPAPRPRRAAAPSSFDRAVRVARRYGEAVEAQQTGAGTRPRPRAAGRPRPLRPAGLPPHPRRHGRPGPLRHLRRLPARPPPRRLLRRARASTIFEGYGLTETTGAVHRAPRR